MSMSHRRLRVLVVHDSPGDREIIEARISIFCDGRPTLPRTMAELSSILAQMDSEPDLYDVVVLDYYLDQLEGNLKPISGADVFVRLRPTKKAFKPYVIFFTVEQGEAEKMVQNSPTNAYVIMSKGNSKYPGDPMDKLMHTLEEIMLSR